MIDLGDNAVIQRERVISAPGAGQELTTSFQDIDFSSFAFTPIRADSLILYQLELQISRTSAGGSSFGSYYITDGFGEWAGSRATYGNSSNSQIIMNISGWKNSWGTSPNTIKVQGREFSSSSQQKVHTTFNYNGGTTSQVHDPILTIMEYK